MSSISAHMIVKNEDQWVWFAISSILPFVDELLITDTGSSDKTEAVIRSISSTKIKFSKELCYSPAEITKVRQSQLKESKNDWIWIVDGDEIYPESTAMECVEATRNEGYEGIVVRRYDLLGDIYHRQVESVGRYELFGHSGHLLIRLINKAKINGLEYRGDYPNEGFFDGEGNSILKRNPKEWYITNNYLYHAMYLKRSSLGGNLAMFNRSKYKVETGISINDSIPEIFTIPRPAIVSNPLVKRGISYELLASIVTPIKNLKRKII